MNRPLLIAIDIQNEYTTPGRPFFLEGARDSLQNASQILQHARDHHWEIVHVKHHQASGIFVKSSVMAEFVEGFSPRVGEILAVKENFSSYSSPAFEKLMIESNGRDMYVIGYGSTMCCLATIVDGYHRGQKFNFVSDASWSKRSSRFTEESMHEHAVDILRAFCKVVNSASILNE